MVVKLYSCEPALLKKEQDSEQVSEATSEINETRCVVSFNSVKGQVNLAVWVSNSSFYVLVDGDCEGSVHELVC